MKIAGKQETPPLPFQFRWTIALFAVVACLPFLFYMSVLVDLRSDEILAKELTACQHALQSFGGRVFHTNIETSRRQRNSSIVIGIPTVQRDNESYLISTLGNLLENMDENEKSVVTILVFIAEADVDSVKLVTQEILQHFSEHLDSGLIEIIAPPPSYYPDLSNLPMTLNDPIDRVSWRSKQNLDYAFLMNYAASRSGYYLQLEDDVVTKSGFVSAIKQFIDENSAKQWLVLDFCHLGFIGKLFRSSDLPDLATFFKLFFKDKPVDWLLTPFITTRYCPFGRADYACMKIHDSLWLKRKISLFQHVGKISSLKGKVQLLKDESFL